jgi:hypothetical protein
MPKWPGQHAAASEVSAVSLVLYGAIALVPTLRHRDDCPSIGGDPDESLAAPPPASRAMARFALLVVLRAAVVGSVIAGPVLLHTRVPGIITLAPAA